MEDDDYKEAVRAMQSFDKTLADATRPPPEPSPIRAVYVDPPRTRKQRERMERDTEVRATDAALALVELSKTTMPPMPSQT